MADAEDRKKEATRDAGWLLSRDVLIAIGAIIWSPPDSAPAYWQGIATAAGGKIDTAVFTEVSKTILDVRDRLDNLNATLEMEDAVATVAKMQWGPGPITRKMRTARKKRTVPRKAAAAKKPTARKKRKGT